jgi:hypothetical protein
MKVLFFARKMPDLCGAFFHDVDLSKELLTRGHQVVFLTIHRPPEGYSGGTWNGFRYLHYSAATSYLDASDIWVCPHSPILPHVRKLNQFGYHRPIVATCHFDGNYTAITGNSPRRQEWVELLLFINRVMEPHYRAAISPWPSQIVRTDVVRPILHREMITMTGDHPHGTAITLINANTNKGVSQFLSLARAMPDHEFLGVLPYYGETSVPTSPDNVEWIPFQQDIRTVLARTRVLLMPSYYESFGRVAIEAMVNGIPVLYSKPAMRSVHPGGSTEGLDDWIRPVGISLPRDDTTEWANALRQLDDPDAYAQVSTASRAHIDAMDVFHEGARIAAMLEEFARQHPITKTTAATPSSASVAPAQGVPVLREPVGRVGLGLLNGRLRLQR